MLVPSPAWCPAPLLSSCLPPSAAADVQCAQLRWSGQPPLPPSSHLLLGGPQHHAHLPTLHLRRLLNGRPRPAVLHKALQGRAGRREAGRRAGEAWQDPRVQAPGGKEAWTDSGTTPTCLTVSGLSCRGGGTNQAHTHRGRTLWGACDVTLYLSHSVLPVCVLCATARPAERPLCRPAGTSPAHLEHLPPDLLELHLAPAELQRQLHPVPLAQELLRRLDLDLRRRMWRRRPRVSARLPNQ